MAPKRHRPSDAGPSSSTSEHFEVNFGPRGQAMRQQFIRLTTRPLSMTRFACTQTLAQLNMLDGVTTLLRKGGLQGILNRGAPTFQGPTLEFLASLERARRGNEDAISFRLMNRAFTMKYSEVAEVFGWAVGGENWRPPNDLETTTFWQHLTGVAYQSKGGNKVNSIVHPCFRMAYKLLNDSMFLQGEVGAVSLFGIKHFWALCHEGVGTPPWVEIFVTGCLKEQGKDKGKITFGGMVTLLANHLGVVFTDECTRLQGGFLYDISFLQSAHFLDYTTGTSQRYLIKGQAPIPLPPTPADLFDIPNRIGTRRLRDRILQRNISDDDDDTDDSDDSDDNNDREGGIGGDGSSQHHQPESSGGGYDSLRTHFDTRLTNLEDRFTQYMTIQDERWSQQQQWWVMQQERWALEDSWREEQRRSRDSQGPGSGPSSS